MNAPFSVRQSTSWVLRVLNGRLAGAEHPLLVGKHLLIGHALDNDIILRGKGTSGISIALDIADDQARLRVISGEVMLLGRPISESQEAILPPYLPVQIGEFAIAIGGESSERWDEASRLGLRLVSADSNPPATERASLAQRVSARLHPLSKQMPSRTLGIALLILTGLILIGLALIAPVTDAIRSERHSPRTVQNALGIAGFSSVKVTRDSASQTIIVSGLVGSSDDVVRLRALLAEQFPGAIADVSTPESLASSATDILQNNKVDAEARAGRGGAITVISEYLPIDRQNELTALLKQDLPALKTVKFQMDGRRGDRDLQYFFSSTSNGLATFVDGNPGYIVTQDQTRWFVGSVVPTGHKIIAIGGGRIVFERNGLIEELIM